MNIIRHPKQLLLYPINLYMRRYVDETNNNMPIKCDTLKVMAKIKKQPGAIIAINGQLTFDHASNISAGIIIEMGKNSKLVVNGNVQLLSGTHIMIGDNAKVTLGSNPNGELSIGQSFKINAKERIEIGSDCLISWSVYLADNTVHKIGNPPELKSSPIVIEDNVWISANCTILKGTTVGRGAVIGANSTVTKSIPSNCLAVGFPAKVVKETIAWQH